MSPSQTILRLLCSPLAFFLLAGCASVPHAEDAATPSRLYKEIVTLSANGTPVTIRSIFAESNP